MFVSLETWEVCIIEAFSFGASLDSAYAEHHRGKQTEELTHNWVTSAEAHL